MAVFTRRRRPGRHSVHVAVENLTPICGVTLEVYARVQRGIAAYRFDRSKSSFVAEGYGVRPHNWEAAESGWATRIQHDTFVGARFRELYAR